jgi:hypothetical protein
MTLNFGRTSLMLVSLVAMGGASALVAVGCSGDDTAGGPGVDAGGGDGSLPDGNHIDGQAPDGNTGDSQTDSPNNNDGNMGDGGALPDAPPLYAYPRAMVQALCARMQFCCLTGSAFDYNKCVATLDNPNAGGVVNTAYFEPVLDGGHVAYDTTAASKCLQEISSFNCGLVDGGFYLQALNDCYAAMAGTIPVGVTGCKLAIECEAGYCDLTGGGDAGGKCTALKALGGTCSDPLSMECSYLGNGVPSSYCEPDGASGFGTCRAQLGADAACNYNEDCKSQLCYGTCTPNFILSDPGVTGGTCDFFTIKDAGDGGG